MGYWLGEVEVVGEVQTASTAVIRDGVITAVDDLCISVQPFFYDLAGVHGRYVGVLNQAVVDNDTNYVYLDAAAALQVTTAGYPAALHLRLGRVITLGGVITRVFLERAFLAATAAGGAPADTAKSGLLIPGNFAGNPKKANVAFASAYPDTQYTITLGLATANDKQFVPVIETKATTGFTVNLSVNNIANLLEVYWHTMPVGE
jgi:hypothetical protein